MIFPGFASKGLTLYQCAHKIAYRPQKMIDMAPFDQKVLDKRVMLMQ